MRKLESIIFIFMVVVEILVLNVIFAETTYEPPQPPQIYIQNDGVMYKVVDGELVETDEIEAGFSYTKIKDEKKVPKPVDK